MQQLAIVKYGAAAGKPLSSGKCPQPEPDPNQVLVQVERFWPELCRRDGTKWFCTRRPRKFPFVPGYEIVGMVTDRVAAVPEKFLGKRVGGFTPLLGDMPICAGRLQAIAELPEDIPGGEACPLATQYLRLIT